MSTDYAKSKQGARRRQFKPTIEASDARRKREEQASAIRKNKRIESIAKRRNTNATDEEIPVVPVSERSREIQALSQAVRTGDGKQQYEATLRFRKLLSIENNPPIQEVIDAGVVPIFVNFLQVHQYPQLQFEAAWALTNVASGSAEQTQYVIECGAVPYMRDLLLSPNDDVREQAIWALGNIAGDSPACRDFVLQHNVLEPVIKSVESTKTAILRNATWALSNFCRGKPQPEWEMVAPAVPVLCKLVYSSDEEVLTDACWALSYLSDGPNERIQAVLETGICRRIVELLLHPCAAVQTPALRTIGNIVTGDDHQTQTALNCQVVPCLLALLGSSKKGLRKEACWTISNITAGNRNQIQSVIDSHVIPKLITLVKGSDFEIKKEAAWALSNTTSGGSTDQIRYLVGQGILDPMCELLTSSDSRLVLVALECMENILKSGESVKNKTGASVNPYTSVIESCSGLDNIEKLQQHSNNDIYEKAVGLLETYFGGEEDQNIAPNQNFNSNTFSFGASNNNNTGLTFSF